MIRLETTFFMMEDPERPMQRRKDPEAQKAYYSGKKKQHTVKQYLRQIIQC